MRKHCDLDLKLVVNQSEETRAIPTFETNHTSVGFQTSAEELDQILLNKRLNKKRGIPRRCSVLVNV